MSVYNGMPYLNDAVESILGQTFKNFEFIIVDDASSDKSWLYLKSLKDKRIRLIKNKKNLGLALSLNRGLKAAKGDFIARMDADDVSLPQRFAEQVKFLINHPKVDIVGTWVKLIDEKGKIIGSVRKPAADVKIKAMNKWIAGLIHPTWMARAEVFKKLGGYNPDYDMVEDYHFLLKAENFKMANIAKELLLWRSQKKRRSQKDIQEMYEKSFKLKWQYFKKGKFGFFYLPFLLRSFISTYFFPIKLKIYLNR